MPIKHYDAAWGSGDTAAPHPDSLHFHLSITELSITIQLASRAAGDARRLARELSRSLSVL